MKFQDALVLFVSASLLVGAGVVEIVPDKKQKNPGRSHDVHELEKRKAASATEECGDAMGSAAAGHAVNSQGTEATGRAAADHAINTKGTGVAGRSEGTCMAIKTKGTGAQ